MRPDASTKIAKVTPKGGPNQVIIGAVIAVLVIVAVVVAIVIGNNGKSGPSASGKAVPVGVVGGTGGGILVDQAAAKSKVPTLDVYVDFQCPFCGRLENEFGPTLTSMAKAAQVKYVVHLKSFLDAKLGNDSSARAANAASCAADAGKFGQYHSAVFAAQPAEGTGYTEDQLTEFARTAGINGSALTTWQKCTTSGQHAQYVTDVETASSRAGVNSTPTVMLNGNDITKTLTTPAALAAAIKGATS